jgi:hypothetical protein
MVIMSVIVDDGKGLYSLDSFEAIQTLDKEKAHMSE